MTLQMDNPMNILAFAATNSRQSINHALIEHAMERLAQIAPGAQIETLDLNDYEMPIHEIGRASCRERVSSPV